MKLPKSRLIVPGSVLGQKVEDIRVLPDGTVWTRKDDGEMIDTGLVMPTPLGHPTLEYGFEVMRRLGVELAAIREQAAQLEAANEKLARLREVATELDGAWCKNNDPTSLVLGLRPIITAIRAELEKP